MTTSRIICIFAVLFSLAGPLPRAHAFTDLLSIRHWVAPDNTRIVIDTSAEVETDVRKTDQKIQIDFKDARAVKKLPAESLLNKPGIQKILVVPVSAGVVRVELWLADYVETRVFKLKAAAGKPYRVVIDIGLPEVEKKESEERKQFKTDIKDKIIVIDPGHGGDDPGAVGRKKTKEKDVVLKISRKLAQTLNSKKGYKAFLTRRGDYYPSFKKRLQIAREYGADLFLSVHADAWKGRSARGSSVYCLTTTSASTVAARLLASEQNLSDIIGGAENDQGTEETDPVTLHMVQTETMNISRDVGASILNRLRKVNALKFRQVQYAPFRVLKLPEIPSVLVETAYISNPKEEALLRSPAFQAKIAEAIALSIEDFTAGTEGRRPTLTARAEEPKRKPPTRVEPASQPETETTLYLVKKGDTLDRVARRHRTTMAVILKLNRMKLDDPLLAGRKLRVPAVGADDETDQEKPVTKKPTSAATAAFAIYTVKRGDTLEKIARRHNITLSALLKLNRMKMKESLQAGRKLKVPAQPEEEEKGTRTVRSKPKVAEKIKPTFYRVKRGDTLEKIARRNDTTIAALLRANRMKLNDPLYVNRKLRLP